MTHTTTETTAPIAPLDAAPIAQSDSPAAIILAIAILLSSLMGGITQLVRIMLMRSGTPPQSGQ